MDPSKTRRTLWEVAKPGRELELTP